MRFEKCEIINLSITIKKNKNYEKFVNTKLFNMNPLINYNSPH